MCFPSTLKTVAWKGLSTQTCKEEDTPGNKTVTDRTMGERDPLPTSQDLPINEMLPAYHDNSRAHDVAGEPVTAVTDAT